MNDAALPRVTCPQCGQSVVAAANLNGKPKPATDYETCIRRCENCGIGFSNAATSDVSKLTRIFRDPLHNIPERVRGGVIDVLSRAVNVRNRPNKVKKFAFSTSEDAITWTVFRGLQLEGQLRATLAAAGLAPARMAAAEPSLLLWGVPTPETDANAELAAARLTQISEAVHDEPQSRSEPDVILDFGDTGCVIIEIKNRSGNAYEENDYAGWADYLNGTQAFADREAVAESGFYELARNWRIVWDFAANRDFALVNLGPKSLFGRRPGSALASFVKGLPASHQTRFVTLSWQTLLSQNPGLPTWLWAYLSEKGIS